MMTNQDKEREREKIEVQVLTGLESGRSLEATPQMWRELRQSLQKRHGKPCKPE